MRAILTTTLLLAACGVADVGTTAATIAKLQAEQAKQDKQIMEKMQADLNAATTAEQQRAANGAAQE
jgi:hypothetical protein